MELKSLREDKTGGGGFGWQERNEGSDDNAI